MFRPMRSKLAACRAVGLKIPVEPERRRPVKETVLVPDDERGLHVVVREDEPQLAGVGGQVEDEIRRVRLARYELALEGIGGRLVAPPPAHYDRRITAGVGPPRGRRKA